MKHRTGYVSNSSSTSFCIIGVDKWTRWFQDDLSFVEVLWELDGMSLEEEEMYEYLGYGYEKGAHFHFYGTYEPEYVGANAQNLLEEMTIPQAKEWFVKEVSRLYHLDIPVSIVKFHIGEAGSG